MSCKPSYDELKQKIKELEKESVMRRQAEEALRECEDRYRMAIERSSDGIAIVIGDRHVYVNEKFAQIFGYDRAEEVVGESLSRFVHPDDQDRVLRFNHSRQQEDKSAPSRYECKGLRKDGRSIYLSVSAGTTTYRGKPASLVFMRDVTERKLTEEKLSESEAKYRMIFENIQDVYYEVTLDGTILEVSPSIEGVSGYRREQLIGKSLEYIYVDPKEREGLVKALLKNGKVTDYEILLMDADRSHVYCSISAGVVRDEHGSPEKIVGSLRNITGRKKIEQALRESISQMQAILEASIDRICYLDKDMKIIWVNKVTASGLAVAAEDLRGQPCYEMLAGRNKPCDNCPTAKAMESGWIERGLVHEVKMENGKEETCWDSYCVPVRNDAGEISSYLQVSRDVTEEKKTMDALHEREATLRAILAASPVGIALSRDRKIGWANKAMYELLGYREEDELQGKSTRLIYPADAEYERVGRELYPALEATGTARMETRWMKKDGGTVHCYLRACLLDPSNPGKGLIVAAMDITDRKEAEEQIQRLSQELIRAQEDERHRISRELHDHVAQDVSMAKFIADQILHSQREVAPSKAIEAISNISPMLQGVIDTVRDLAYDLRPPFLDDMGLVHAVSQYCEEFSERTGQRVDFSFAGMEGVYLDFNAKINLYRLIQEGLNNIIKHAEAGCATIKLIGAFPDIILRIEDDGKGFDVNSWRIASSKEKKMGLHNMEQRVLLLQGRMKIHSRPMKGTKITIRIPSREINRDSQENHIDR